MLYRHFMQDQIVMKLTIATQLSTEVEETEIYDVKIIYFIMAQDDPMYSSTI
jgi:hypothetical protein